MLQNQRNYSTCWCVSSSIEQIVLPIQVKTRTCTISFNQTTEAVWTTGVMREAIAKIDGDNSPAIDPAIFIPCTILANSILWGRKCWGYHSVEAKEGIVPFRGHVNNGSCAQLYLVVIQDVIPVGRAGVPSINSTN